ncbi:tachylectin-related carbohydrate-binding protein [Kribbella sp. NPDC056951]|uniref:tachylectin-related carbohydrate-binding protein n=1 Tax=Kribbella sp. NPDC056951 TaxID=3345978 RepID=UPI00362FA5F2
MSKIPISRRQFGALAAGTALTAAGLVNATSAIAAGGATAAVPGPDARVATAFEAAGDSGGLSGFGALYGLRDTGELTWNKFDILRADGSTVWSAPKVIATGWTDLVHLFADNIAIYTIDASGALRWHSYSAPSTGDGQWAAGSGAVIGSGWQTMTKVAYAGSGIFFAVDDAGNLRWYRHTDPSGGAASWADGSGRIIDDGWSDLHALAAAGGIIYAAAPSGVLRWYQYTDTWSGQGSFHPNSGSVIDDGGWQLATSLRAGFTSPWATLRTLDAGSTLRWFRHLDPLEGGSSWDPRSGAVAAESWPR